MHFVIFYVYILSFFLRINSNGINKLKCWKCTWDRDYKEEVLKVKDPKPTEKIDDDDDEIHNPSVEPICGKESWEEPTSNNLLWKKCKNCTDGDACVRWTFKLLGSKNPIRNVTRMCAITNAKSGCYVQNMDNGWQKEVCLCRKNNCNGRATLSLPNFSLIIVVLFIVKLIAPC